MLQRKQTLFLLIAIIALIIMPFFPIAKYYGDFSFVLNLFNFNDMTGEAPFSAIFNLPLIAIWAIALLLSVITVFLYKKRNLQLRLTSVAIVLIMVLLLLVFIYYTPMIERDLGAFNIKTVYTNCVSIYMPIVAFLFLVLAFRYIKKDINILKSVDRLR